MDKLSSLERTVVQRTMTRLLARRELVRWATLLEASVSVAAGPFMACGSSKAYASTSANNQMASASVSQSNASLCAVVAQRWSFRNTALLRGGRRTA